jgi:hypothetical protein
LCCRSSLTVSLRLRQTELKLDKSTSMSRLAAKALSSFGKQKHTMKRLGNSRPNRFVRWWHRNLGLLAWYKYASKYGESYGRPVLWLVFVLTLSVPLYPVAGLQHHEPANESLAATRAPMTYWHPCPAPGKSNEGACLRQLVGHSALAALYIAAFQRELVFEPSYPWGRLLALVEVLVTSHSCPKQVLAV